MSGCQKPASSMMIFLIGSFPSLSPSSSSSSAASSPAARRRCSSRRLAWRAAAEQNFWLYSDVFTISCRSPFIFRMRAISRTLPANLVTLARYSPMLRPWFFCAISLSLVRAQRFLPQKRFSTCPTLRFLCLLSRELVELLLLELEERVRHARACLTNVLCDVPCAAAVGLPTIEAEQLGRGGVLHLHAHGGPERALALGRGGGHGALALGDRAVGRGESGVLHVRCGCVCSIVDADAGICRGDVQRARSRSRGRRARPSIWTRAPSALLVAAASRDEPRLYVRSSRRRHG